MDHGESEWTESIHNQIRRLSGLTNQLVTLARMDEENGFLKKENFDLSEAVYDTVQGFASVAQTREAADRIANHGCAELSRRGEPDSSVDWHFTGECDQVRDAGQYDQCKTV